MSTTVRIRRRQMPSSRFAAGPGPAWVWRYDADLPNGRGLRGIERLSIIERMIKDAGCAPVRAWTEVTP